MLIKEEAREIERFSITNEKAFSIKATGKAFKVLSSSLYKDKIRAVIRELSCNAYDAHIAAGKKDIPFLIHLPNPIEQFFLIRDYGTGLSQEDVENIYTTYFESTKTDSNDFIGALGLGSKSPFSYVDSFTVCSYFNGEKYQYAAFISEFGEPKISLMSKIPTKEENGLEISLNVKYSADYRQFIEKARSVLSHFKTKPIVVGSSEFKFDDDESFIQGTDWVVNEPNAYRYGEGDNKALAIMGNVAYPIAQSAIQGLHENVKMLYRLCINITFSIGDLDITAGREDLSYDKATLKKLEEKGFEILREAPSIFQKLFDDLETEFDARILFGQLFHNYKPATFFAGLRTSILWKNILISSNDFEIKMEDFEDATVTFFNQYRHRYRNSVERNTFTTKHKSIINITASKNTAIVFIDTENPIKTRISAYVKEKTKSKYVITIKCNDKEREELEKKLKGFEFEYASQLPKPPRKIREKFIVEKDSVEILQNFAFTQGSYNASINSNHWRLTEIDPKEGGFYVHKRGNGVVMNGETENHKFAKIITNAYSLGFINTTTKIYGINAIIIKKFKKSGEWIDFLEYIKEKIETVSTDNELIKRVQTSLMEREYYSLKNARRFLLNVATRLSTDHEFKKFMDEWVDTKAEDTNAYLNTICDILNIKLFVSSQCIMKDKWLAFQKKYPFFYILTQNEGFTKIKADHVIKYIEWIDHQPEISQ